MKSPEKKTRDDFRSPERTTAPFINMALLKSDSVDSDFEKMSDKDMSQMEDTPRRSRNNSFVRSSSVIVPPKSSLDA